jgi:hypothetical protein
MGRRHHKKHESSSESSCTESESSCSESENSYVSESELDEVECKLTKKMERLYCKFLWRLRREPCLMINGSEAHAAMYSNTTHSIPVGNTIPMDVSQYLVNIVFNPLDNSLTVQRDGLYYFSYTVIFDQPCQISVFVNNVVDPSTSVGNNSGATITVGTQLLRLNAGDKVDLRNWKSNSTLTLAFPAAGDQTIPTTNADFTLFKIAPLVSKCGEFPIPFPTPTCQECEQEPHTPPHSPHPHPHPHHDSPKKCHSKDKKCEKKFKKLDKNDDGVLSYDEYKKYCEKRHRHHKH